MTPIATDPAPRTAPRQRSDARRNRAKVLAAAHDQFARHGLDAQIDDIARAAGVGVGTVYRHFPRKEDLLAALADLRFENFAEAAAAALEADGERWEAFAAFMTHCARTMAEERWLSEAMEQLPNVCGPSAERSGLRALNTELVAATQREGRLRADIVAEDIPALICGIGRAVRADGGQPVMSWDRYLAIILAGLEARE